jgi:hypothetical protein
MTTLSKPIVERRGSYARHFNWNYFLQDNLTGSKALTIWVVFIALVTVLVAVLQLNSAPLRSTILIALWAIGILSVAVGELFTLHNPVSRWLKENLLSSISNTLVTLLLMLLVAQVVGGLWQWGVVNASFDPALTAPQFRNPDGATWGVLWGARKLLLTGALSPVHTWRVLLAAGMVAVLWAFSYTVSRPSLKAPLLLQRISITLWLLAPFAAYIFLAGLRYSEPFMNVRTLLSGTAVTLAVMALLWLSLIHI